MKKDDIRYKTYIKILEEELVPAFGCTEPIALAYAAARAREVLGDVPDRVVLQVSGSIIKNVKSVIVPNTNHLKGIPAAAAAGPSRCTPCQTRRCPDARARDSGRAGIHRMVGPQMAKGCS